MGVSLDIYRARIGLHHLRVSSSFVNIGKYCLCSTLLFDSLLELDLLMLASFSMVLLLSGDVELNPGPNRLTKRYFTFCHANMRSVKRCSDKLDHIRAEFVGTYDVITVSETWLSPDDNLDQYGKPMYRLDTMILLDVIELVVQVEGYLRGSPKI